MDKRDAANYREASAEEKAWKVAVARNEVARAEFLIIETQRRLERAKRTVEGYAKVDAETPEGTAAAYGWTGLGSLYLKRVECHGCHGETELVLTLTDGAVFTPDAGRYAEKQWTYRWVKGTQTCTHPPAELNPQISVFYPANILADDLLPLI